MNIECIGRCAIIAMVVYSVWVLAAVVHLVISVRRDDPTPADVIELHLLLMGVFAVLICEGFGLFATALWLWNTAVTTIGR